MFCSESESVGPDEDDDEMLQWTYDSHERETENHLSPQSSGHIPEYPEFTFETRTDSVGCTKEEDKDVFQNIYEVKEPNQDTNPLEQKPWRKPGADITDYFNYGFNEESWKVYCRRHSRLQAFQKQHIAKVMREWAKYEEVMSCSPSTSSRKSRKSRRQRKAKTAKSRGKAGSSSQTRSSSRREKARPCRTDVAKDTQVAAGVSHEKNNAADYDSPRSASVRTVHSFVAPGPSLSHFDQSAWSSNLGNFEEPSTSLYPYFVGNMATDSTVIDSANAWEPHVKHKRDRDRDRDRSGGRGHDRKRRRYRDEGKQSSSSSRHSERMQTKHRDSTEHVYRCRRTEGVTGKKMQRDEEERLQNTSQSRSSNISRRDDREDRKTRHDHTKGKDVERPRKATEKRK